jgi:hypothetical protein
MSKQDKCADKAQEIFSLINNLSPEWVASNFESINKLSHEHLCLLERILWQELNSEIVFREDESTPIEFNLFSFEFSNLVNQILGLVYKKYEIASSDLLHINLEEDKRLFIQKVARQIDVEGYSVFRGYFPKSYADDLTKALTSYEFSSRVAPQSKYFGREMIEHMHKGSQPSVLLGDTFWLLNQDGIVRDPIFWKLAFDPFILSVVSEYFGCTPIHVQTNSWFSFPTKEEVGKLSSNAQEFHQDKEFMKFLKVFIYLNDVGVDNGPHAYVEGSHRDTLFSKGINYSDRVSDYEIKNYYDHERIKVVSGPVGTLIFGDTSCAHKGMQINSGSRLILQLEYASTLFLSGVRPFESPPNIFLDDAVPTQRLTKRILSNYSHELRDIFDNLWGEIRAQNKAKTPGFVARAKAAIKLLIN